VAYTAYLERGSPKTLTSAQIATLQKLTEDLPVHELIMRAAAYAAAQLTVPMNSNDIVVVRVKPAGRDH
jgi:xylan 1,4-beta-xylosidase